MPLFDVCCILSKDGSTPYLPCENCDDDSIDGLVASPSHNFKFFYEDNFAECTRETGHGKIFFKAGCSGDPSDLVNLVKLYQDSDDRETLKHWMDIYTQQRQKTEPRNEEVSFADESANNLSELSNVVSSDVKELPYKTMHSLDHLVLTEDSGEVFLEKCHSLDYRKQVNLDTSIGLRRCQEMSNISLLDS